eukprot:TRINITY_DN3738_c0_g1_i7.p1 TRINITY_DN3738_c0_g1~~TRINITY_DN3738_c0_g1_i7.p1  ORF type:complete len:331 (+),score=41.70 TRINITY_DN3738_c0_g1_i7:138-1130(+)
MFPHVNEAERAIEKASGLPVAVPESKETSRESQVLQLIHRNELDSLKALGIRTANMNFLVEFDEVEIDTKITPLICACYFGRSDIVKMLLSNPTIDVDLATDESGFTPLCIACVTANYEIVKLLLDHDAEVNKPSVFNQTPLVYCFSRLEEESHFYENKKIAMMMAELLLQYGADINWIVDKSKGYTLLMQFCSMKQAQGERERELNMDVIKFLLEHGADRNLKSHRKEKDAFMIAEKHYNKEKVLESLNAVKQIYFYTGSKPQLSARTSTSSSPSRRSVFQHQRSRSTAIETTVLISPDSSPLLPPREKKRRNSRIIAFIQSVCGKQTA